MGTSGTQHIYRYGWSSCARGGAGQTAKFGTAADGAGPILFALWE